MGIGVDLAWALMQEGVPRKFDWKIVTLGVQDIFLCTGAYASILKEFKIQPKIKLELTTKASLAKDGFISDSSFFKNNDFNDFLRINSTDYKEENFIFYFNRKM